MNTKIKVMIADDHELVRTGLGSLIDLNADMRCVGLVKNGALAVKCAAKARPDVIVMDLAMPVLGGIEATRQILAENADVRVLILTSYGTPDELRQVLEAGAAGILLKSSPNRNVLKAIRQLHEGQTVLEPKIKAMIADRSETVTLSDRQSEVLRFVARGLSNGDIATAFGITLAGVKKHLELIYAKLGVATRTEAIAKALHDKLISP